MRDNYDFSDAIKNPFSGREKGKFVVKIDYDPKKQQRIQKRRSISKKAQVVITSKSQVL